ncbi:sugar transport protein 8-like [Andrographis paniculata]|uniref:sugar transport protein 8-like n=1 Tax=Andrographis paniculata TaxID=175694 RepID=UPI0021E8CE2D|nr:sugar transport protein 8-like [Andrographis paniculata]
MAPEVAAVTGGGGSDFPARLTAQVVVCSLIAAFGGLMFGYDIGISGGVTGMDEFLLRFFPGVYEKKHHTKENNYCKFDDQLLQLFTSSLYLAAVVCSWLASFSCNKFGRKRTMQMASVFFLVGVGLNAAAQNLGMLIAGRLCLGAGVGFGNQAVPVFISEISPAKYRGGLNICFQLMITIGILVANVVNFFTSKLHDGWRYSLGGAGFPAIFLGLGSLIIVETPTSLIERGHKEQGLRSLQRIRGVGAEEVKKEYDEIVRATAAQAEHPHPFRNLLTKKSSFPQLFVATIFQVFQQFTGINVVMFYAPVLFQTMGLGSDASLLSSVVMGTVNVLSTLVAVFAVDRFGRRVLLMQAAVQMVMTQVAMGVLLATHLGTTNVMAKGYAYLMLALICLYVMAFAWSWGPLGWLIASEVFPAETRTAGFFVAVSTNMVCTFIIAQSFLSMLCTMRAASFFFFAGWIVVMGSFATFLLPETKGIPIEEMTDKVWKKHWFWRRFYDRPNPTPAA